MPQSYSWHRELEVVALHRIFRSSEPTGGARQINWVGAARLLRKYGHPVITGSELKEVWFQGLRRGLRAATYRVGHPLP